MDVRRVSCPIVVDRDSPMWLFSRFKQRSSLRLISGFRDPKQQKKINYYTAITELIDNNL